jgi:hypothetical protein
MCKTVVRKRTGDVHNRRQIQPIPDPRRHRGRAMVGRNGIHRGMRKSPQIEQMSAYFRMTCAEHFALGQI